MLSKIGDRYIEVEREIFDGEKYYTLCFELKMFDKEYRQIGKTAVYNEHGEYLDSKYIIDLTQQIEDVIAFDEIMYSNQLLLTVYRQEEQEKDIQKLNAEYIKNII